MIAASAVLVVVAIGTLIFGVVWTDGLKMIGVSIAASVGAGGLLILGVRRDKTLSPAMVGAPAAGSTDAIAIGGTALLEPAGGPAPLLDEPDVDEPEIIEPLPEPADATSEMDLGDAFAAPSLDDADEADDDEVEDDEVIPAPPAARKPAARKTAPKKPAARKPAAKKPAAKKPAARKPAAKKPAAKKPAAKKPAARKPAAKKAAARKPAANKPAAKKAAARKPKAAPADGE